MINKNLYHGLTAFTVIFSFLTICVSKAGMNIAFGLILLTCVVGVSLKQPLLSKEPFQRRISLFSIGLYALGLSVVALSASGLQDLVWFARKGAFLLLVPFLIPLLTAHHDKAFKALLVGLVIAIGYSIYLFLTGQSFGEGRLQSFWDIGRWGEILAYITIMLISLVYCNKSMGIHIRGGLLCLAIVSFCALIASGSRGPMLFFFITLVLFFAFNNRKFFLGLLVVTAVALLVMKESVLFHSIYERVASIFANDNASNNARLLMWRNALGFIEFNIQHSFSTFLFGTGDSSLETLLTQYLNSVGSIEQMQMSVHNQMSLNDFHNLYLDSTIRMGAIFTVGYLSFIGYLLLSLYKMSLNGNILSWMSISLIVTYLGIGTVYSNNLEFQTAIVFFLLALCITWPKLDTSTTDCKKEGTE